MVISKCGYIHLQISKKQQQQQPAAKQLPWGHMCGTEAPGCSHTRYKQEMMTAASLLVYSLQLISETLPGCGTGLNFWRQTMWLRCIEIKIFKVRLLIVKLRPFRKTNFMPNCVHILFQGSQYGENHEAYWCRGQAIEYLPVLELSFWCMDVLLASL